MTDPQPSYPPPGHTVQGGTAQPKPKRRIFRWFFLAVQIIFLIWIIVGANSGSSSVAKSCKGLVGQALQTCTDASHAGTGIGVALIIILWVVVDVLLVLIWAVMRLTSRNR